MTDRAISTSSINKKNNSVIGKIKGILVNEFTTLVISAILSIIITIALCIPAKDFLFTDRSSIYGISYESITFIKYTLLPIGSIMVTTFLVGYVFNRESIKKISYINENSKNEIIASSAYLTRLLIIVVMIVIASVMIKSKGSFRTIESEFVVNYVYKKSIIYGVLLSILSSLILFLGVDKKYYNVVEMKYFEEENRRVISVKQKYNSIYEDLNNEYLRLSSSLINDVRRIGFDYYNTYFKEVLHQKEEDTNNNKYFSLSLVKENNSLTYERNKKFIEAYTNEDQYFSFNNQINNMNHKFGSYEKDDIILYFEDMLDMDLCRENLKLIEKIKNNKCFSDVKNNYLDTVLLECNNYIDNIININNDIKTYLKDRTEYLSRSFKKSKSGYDGELRVKEELNKFKDYITNIENKCFNFRYMDFIDENYTMECDNILITQRGIFIVETKNYGEDSLYIDSEGNSKNKYILHIESNGKWKYEYPNGDLKANIKKTPVEQNRDHVIKLEKILNHHFGYDIYDEDYIEVRSIIVIGNENIHIKNDLEGSFDVCVPKGLYDKISKYPKNSFFNRNNVEKIISIIESYDNSIHKPNKYEIINVEKEINNLDYILREVTHKGGKYPYRINHMLKKYDKELQDISDKYLDELAKIRS